MSIYVPHPRRIQRKRTKGFRMPEGTVCVSRPGPWGNPFKASGAIEAGYARNVTEANALCVKCFEDWLYKGDLSEWWFGPVEPWLVMRSNLASLYGKTLACWCPLDRPCHGDVLARAADRSEFWPKELM